MFSYIRLCGSVEMQLSVTVPNVFFILAPQAAAASSNAVDNAAFLSTRQRGGQSGQQHGWQQQPAAVALDGH